MGPEGNWWMLGEKMMGTRKAAELGTRKATESTRQEKGQQREKVGKRGGINKMLGSERDRRIRAG